MTNTIPPNPFMSTMVDSRGMVTQPWATYFRDLLAHVDGSTGTGNAQLLAQTQILQNQITALQGKLNDFGQGRTL